MSRRAGSRDVDGQELSFQIVRFDAAPFPGATTFASLGISRVPLRAPSGRDVRLELLFACRDAFAARNVPAILQQLGLEALSTETAYLRGQTVGPRGRLFPAGELEAIYFALPVYWPDSLGVYSLSNGDKVQLVWAVPIHASEALFVSEFGWSEFEKRLGDRNPDLLDLERVAVA
ncbi:MAG: hypothetical protein QOD07_2967 [Frankiaceae bacterium]|nr:hypothetical protein [Frankiaceae bacterium]